MTHVGFSFNHLDKDDIIIAFLASMSFETQAVSAIYNKNRNFTSFLIALDLREGV